MHAPVFIVPVLQEKESNQKILQDLVRKDEEEYNYIFLFVVPQRLCQSQQGPAQN